MFCRRVLMGQGSASGGAAEVVAAQGERIAKRIARAGVCSRRRAEQLIESGRVQLNGMRVATPVTFVQPGDEVRVDGRPIALEDPEPKLWMHYKRRDVLVSHPERSQNERDTMVDAQGRRLLFPHVQKMGVGATMSVGRLDYTTEGLLLLTNHGGLARAMELPENGLEREYRARVYGVLERRGLQALRKGVRLADGIRCRPMDVEVDQARGKQAWLTMVLREGKNREVRRALSEIGLQVTRLIRTAYGPYRILEGKQKQHSTTMARVLRPGEIVQVPVHAGLKNLLEGDSAE